MITFNLRTAARNKAHGSDYPLNISPCLFDATRRVYA